MNANARMDLAPEQRTIPYLLRERAERFGDKPAFTFGNQQYSYRELAEAISATAGMLQEHGIGPGDRVAIMSENRTELVELILGCAWIGAVAVPLNTALRGDGLEYQLTDSSARILAIEADLISRLHVVAMPPTLERVWVIGAHHQADSLDGYATTTTVPVGELPGHGRPVRPAEVDPATIGAILYTSGSTGPPKGVMCPHAQFIWWGQLVGTQLEITEADVLYTPLPVFHVNALGALFQALVRGATLHLGPRFSASRMFDRLRESGATVTYLLGVMVSILESRPPSPGDREHRVSRALAPGASDSQLEVFRTRFGIELLDSYGSTETNGVIGVTVGEQRGGWMGPVRDGFEAIVADDADNELPDDTVGELLVRSHIPFAMASGYLGFPEKTIDSWRNLWFHTGDLVERSPDGWFRFHDRKSDSIRRRGENISSWDVENVVRAHAGVAAVAAYALPSELGEDEVAVAVVRHNGAALDEEELVRWCEGRIAYFAVPRYIRFVDELPLTENGKVRKGVLRAAGGAESWDRDAAGVVVARG